MGRLLAAMTSECEEARNYTHWKWWKKYEKEIDRQQLKLELIDIWHFFITACLAVGMDAKEFEELYFKKLHTNHIRQDIGYNDMYPKYDEGKEDNERLIEGTFDEWSNNIKTSRGL
jgi:hypothetical protein